MAKRSFNIIVAHTKNLGIGYNNKLPWNQIKEDMAHFKEITTRTVDTSKQNSVIMGRKTWDSIPEKYKPLPNRHNLIVSNTININNAYAKTFTDLDSALNYSYKNPEIEKTFVIGGGNVYKQAINRMDLDKIITTVVNTDYNCDTYFPNYPQWIVKKNSVKINDLMSIDTYENVADLESDEKSYLDCMKYILDNGEMIKDRTGVGVLSVFDKNLRFTINTINPDEKDQTKLKYRVPIMTTKNLYLKGVFWELIWFLQGNTDANWLKERDVHIWDGNTTKEFLKKRGLDYEEGQLGPGYGHQWVNWGGDWKTKTGGINQIKNIIDLLRDDPTSRRAVLSAWNVSDLNKMALPPCHIMYIFKVSDHNQKKKLNCKVTIRSNDMFLGNPFNIMSTALLTIFLSRSLNMLPGDISISITDAHIYLNHVEQTKKQLSRIPLKSPILEINKNINNFDDIVNLTYDNIILSEYYKWPAIKAEMAI